MIKSTMWVMGVTFVAMSAALPARAGEKLTLPITINKSGLYAYGAMGTGRAEADGGASIGCTVSAYKGSPASVFCGAETTASGYVWAGCSSTDPALVQAALALTSDANLQFGWDASGACTFLSIDVSSSLDPKQP